MCIKSSVFSLSAFALVFLNLLSSCSKPRNTSLDGADIDDLLRSELWELDEKSGELVKAKLPKNTRYVLFYASASWCGPCQVYTPVLKQWYEKTQQQNSEFEVVLVSGDSSQESLDAYVKKSQMPWKCLSYLASQSDTMLEFKVGYPSSYLVDLQTGKTLAKDAGLQGVGGLTLHATVETLEEALAQ